MFSNWRRHATWLSLALLVAWGTTGCGDDGGGGGSDIVDEGATGSLQGDVSLYDGASPAGAVVSVVDVSGLESTLDPSGIFAFLEVPVGTHTLRVTMAGYADHEEQVSIEKGRATTVSVVLQGGTNADPTIESLVIEPAVLAVGGSASATVVASDADGDTLTYEWSGTDGFTLTPGPAGTATVTAPATDNASGSVTVVVTDGRGGSAEATEAVSTGTNQAPVINSITVNPLLPQPGGTASVTVSATDTEGESLSYAWAISPSTWTLVGAGTTATITAPNAFGALATVSVTVTDAAGGQATQSVDVSSVLCAAGLADCDADASNGCEPARSGATAICPATSCRRALLDGYAAAGDGTYWLDLNGGVEPFEAYCDMTADGGGWTLLGTISGADANNWNTQFGYWSDGNLLGTATDPWLDYKSKAWTDMNILEAEVMMQRRFDGTVRAQSVLANSCLDAKDRFTKLFNPFLMQRVCLPGDIRVLTADATGLSAAAYVEGGNVPTLNLGLGGSGTNGFCWTGEDNQVYTFKGHLVWNDLVNSDSCSAGAHVGGVGVFEHVGTQFTNSDITGTTWLIASSDPTQYALTDISLFARETGVVVGARTAADPGRWSDGAFAASCNAYRYPQAFTEYRGATGDGIYTIDVDGYGPVAPVKVFCDMTTDGGGWTAIVANGDNTVDETTDAGDCYPLISPDAAVGCGDPTDMLADFTVPGTVQKGLVWRYMLGIAYGDSGYDEKLAHFGVDFAAAAATTAERINGVPYMSGLGTTYGVIGCTGYSIAHYVRGGGLFNDVPGALANGRGTIFGHNSVQSMSDQGRLSFGFTDTEDRADGMSSAAGLDDYEDGWGCADAWSPQQARGARMVILVR